MSEQQSPDASAGTPGGRSPSGATSPGATPVDAVPGADPAAAGAAGERLTDTQVPGQAPGATASPVPSPGDVPGASLPAVSAGQGASPETGIHEGSKEAGSDASIASPGAAVALAPEGHPDGEVDTRAR